MESEQAPPRGAPPPTRLKSHFYALYALMLAGLILFWVSNARLQDFKRSQETVAETTVRNARVRIEELVSERRRLVQIFANKHLDLIHSVYRNPDLDGADYTALVAEVRDFFPDFFAITVANPLGVPVVEDFEGYVGEVCVADMHTFTASGAFRMRIHPNPYVYHVDVMAPWQHAGAAGMFFVSFKPDFIANLLKAVEALDHRLLLATDDSASMIEITSGGARNAIAGRDDFRLSKEELGRVLHQEKVAGTAWILMDQRASGFFEAEERELKYAALAVYAGIAAMIGLLWLVAYRQEKQRLAAEESLKQSLKAITELNVDLGNKHGELLEKQQILDEEKELAAEVFDRITRRHPLNERYLRLYSQAMSSFNGDLVLTYEHGDGPRFISVSDFTGHGLPAALGALPYAEVFYDAVRTQPLVEVIRAINDKLHDLLPLNRFCCSVIVQADTARNTLAVCNAGMPDFILVFKDGTRRGVPSNLYPIGIRKLRSDEIPLYEFPLDDIDRVYVYSDGATEMLDMEQEMLGAERLSAFLTGRPFSEIQAFLDDFRGQAAITDDVTVLEINVTAMLATGP